MKPLRRTIAALSLLWVALSPLAAIAQAPPAVGALPDSERRTSYSLNASTCICAINMQLYASGSDVDAWLQVWVAGVRYLSTDPTFGWSLSSTTGPLTTIPRPITNAVLTFNSAVTGTVQIVGAERPRQLAQFSENTGVPARALNQRMTEITAVERELWDKTNDLTGRGLFFAPGNTTGPMPQPSACVNNFLGFDATGLNPECLAVAPTGSLVVPGSTTINNIVLFNSTNGRTFSDSGASIFGINTGVVNIQTANYVIVPSDCSKTILVGTGSTGSFTLTLPAITGFSSQCSILIKNGDTAASKTLSGFPSDLGATLGALQSFGIRIVNGAWSSFYAASVGNGVSSVSNSDGTMTISPTTGAVVASLALNHANTWTAPQNLTINQNNNTQIVISNNSAGTLALANLEVTNGTAIGNIGTAGANYSSIPLLTNRTFINAVGGAGIALLNNDAQPIIFATNNTYRGGLDSLGQWIIGPTSTAPTNTAILLAINNNTQACPQKPTGTVVTWTVQMCGADATSPGIAINSFGTGNTSAFSVLSFFRANNTAAAPAALKSGDLVGVLGGIGYYGIDYSLDQWQIRYYATQDWTSTHWGTAIAMVTTPNNSTTIAEVARFDQSGFVGIGTNAPQTKLHVNNNVTQNVPTNLGGLAGVAQFTGADASQAIIQLDAFGTTNTAFTGFQFNVAAGTAASRSGVAANAIIGYLAASAYTSAGAYSSPSSMQFVTEETQTGSNQGMRLDLFLVPKTTNTVALAARFWGSGGLSVGNTTDPGIGSISANVKFVAAGNNGQTVTTTVRAAGGAADCTLIFTGGIKTGGTC